MGLSHSGGRIHAEWERRRRERKGGWSRWEEEGEGEQGEKEWGQEEGEDGPWYGLS